MVRLWWTHRDGYRHWYVQIDGSHKCSTQPINSRNLIPMDCAFHCNQDAKVWSGLTSSLTKVQKSCGSRSFLLKSWQLSSSVSWCPKTTRLQLSLQFVILVYTGVYLIHTHKCLTHFDHFQLALTTDLAFRTGTHLWLEKWSSTLGWTSKLKP